MIHTENTILIKAPLERIFASAANLAEWPRMLPHYRWIKYLEQSPARNKVQMAAWRFIPRRGGLRLPIRWTSEQRIDADNKRIWFTHLKSFSRGMNVLWTFDQKPDGVQVRITHDFASTVPVIGPVAIEPIVGRFLAHVIADQTLHHLKNHVEAHRGT